MFFERAASQWRTLRTLRQQYSREIWPTCRFIRIRVVISKNKVTCSLTNTEGVLVNGGNGTTRRVESIGYMFTCTRSVFTFARQILGHVGGGLRWKIPSLWSVKGADKVACPAPGRNAMKAIRLDPPEARRFFFCCSPFRQSVSAGETSRVGRCLGIKRGKKQPTFCSASLLMEKTLVKCQALFRTIKRKSSSWLVLFEEAARNVANKFSRIFVDR